MVSSKRGGRDAIYVVDSKNGKVLPRGWNSRGLVAINDPVARARRQSIVFSAQDYGGRSDLYRASWPDKQVQLERMTARRLRRSSNPTSRQTGKWVGVRLGPRRPRRSLLAVPYSRSTGGPIETLERSGDRRRSPAGVLAGRHAGSRTARLAPGRATCACVRPTLSLEARRVTQPARPRRYDPDWTSEQQGPAVHRPDTRSRFQTYRIARRSRLARSAESRGAGAACAGAADTRSRRRGVALPAPARSSTWCRTAIAVDPGAGGAGGEADRAQRPARQRAGTTSSSPTTRSASATSGTASRSASRISTARIG